MGNYVPEGNRHLFLNMTVLTGLTDTSKIAYCGLSLKNQEKLTKIKSGLENGEFKIYLQPICDLVTGTPWGYETLSRWHRYGQPVSAPGDYIPLLTVTQNVHLLCHRTIRRALGLVPLIDLPLSINIYPSTVKREDWNVYEEILLSSTGLRPKLEILETEEIGPIVRDRIQKLSQKLWVSLDDFGTGFSTFSSLTRLGIKAIKLDLSLIINIHEKESQIICRSIIDLAHQLGLKVVAEGIETQMQRGILLELGCDFGQGFFFSAPRPVSYFYPHLSGKFQ